MCFGGVHLPFSAYAECFVQAKPQTVEKVSQIVKKQLALSDDSNVTGESKFAALGADSLDTVTEILLDIAIACI